MQTRLERRNGTVLVPIPAEVAEAGGFTGNEIVELLATPGRLTATVTTNRVSELDALVALITDDNLHSEIDAGPPVGAEAW